MIQRWSGDAVGNWICGCAALAADRTMRRSLVAFSPTGSQSYARRSFVVPSTYAMSFASGENAGIQSWLPSSPVAGMATPVDATKAPICVPMLPRSGAQFSTTTVPSGDTPGSAHCDAPLLLLEKPEYAVEEALRS